MNGSLHPFYISQAHLKIQIFFASPFTYPEEGKWEEVTKRHRKREAIFFLFASVVKLAVVGIKDEDDGEDGDIINIAGSLFVV